MVDGSDVELTRMIFFAPPEWKKLELQFGFGFSRVQCRATEGLTFDWTEESW